MNTSLVKSSNFPRAGELVKTGVASTLARSIASRNAGDKLPLYVTREQVAAALATFPGPISPGRLFVLALWQTGARVSELLGARVGDLHFADSTLRLRTLKRRTKDGQPRVEFRLVPLQTDLAGVLAQYLHAGLPVDKHDRGASSGNPRLWPFCRGWAWYTIQRAFAAAGIDPALAHPHSMRHGHAVHALKAGVPLTAVQETLGHASIQSTTIYGRLTLQDRRRAYQGADFEVSR